MPAWALELSVSLAPQGVDAGMVWRGCRYDSILGTFDADIKITGDDTMTLNGRTVKVVSERNPLNLPWKEMGIDIVIESTGALLAALGVSRVEYSTQQPKAGPSESRMRSSPH
jgi:glyceraldehyde-3-phosphate dehydrogenase/erythrose-4-phosphate dehydrogenase